MTISKIVSCEVVGSAGIVEISVPKFSNRERVFKKDMELLDSNTIYKRVAEDIYIEDYSSNKEYSSGDIVWYNNMLHFIDANIGQQNKQPKDYSNLDDFSKFFNEMNPRFKSRYAILDLKKFPYIYLDVDTNRYYYYEYEISNNKIKFKTTRFIKNYEVEPTCEKKCSNSDNKYSNYAVEYDDFVQVYQSAPCLGRPISKPSDYNTYYRTNIGNFFINNYGEGISLSNKGAYCNGKDTSGYFVYKKTTIESDFLTIHTASDKNTYEPALEILKEDRLIFLPKFIISQDGIYYFRTDNDIPAEIVNIEKRELKPLNHINDVDWGWVAYKPSQTYAPFDIKQYTLTKQYNDISYSIKANDSFDVIALSKLRASFVEIIVKDLKNKRVEYLKKKINSNSSIAIIYLNQTYYKNYIVTINIHTFLGYLEVGMITLGRKKALGLTLADFSVSVKDFSVYEQDEWGNISYTKRTRLNRVDYKVDVDTKNFDETLKFLKNNTGEITIIDGNDNTSNEVYDNINYFESVSMVGRFRDFKLKPKIAEDGNLLDTSQYTFGGEEIV